MECFEESIEIHADVSRCFEAWRNFQVFSSMMFQIKATYPIDEDVWRWELIGDQGDESTWDMVLVRVIPDSLLSWRSIAGPLPDMWWDVHFIPLGKDCTEVMMSVCYFMPSNHLEKVSLDLFGLSRDTVRKNLRSFKVLVEHAQIHKLDTPSEVER